MKTLPSESAQHLATYLCEHEDEFLTHYPGNIERVVRIDLLSQLIEQYWNSLDEHN